MMSRLNLVTSLLLLLLAPWTVHASLADDLKDVETTDNTMELLLHTVLHMDEQMKQMRQEVTQLKQENESYRRLEKMLVDENVEGEEKDSVVDVDEAHRRLPTLFQTVNQLKFQLNQLRNQYKATELQHNDRISALETDVATTRDAENKNLDRITAMTTDLEAIQSKATKLSDDLIQGLTSVNGRITGFENAMTAIEEAGGQATQQIQNMLSRVSAVETKTGVAESRLSGMISSNEQTIADISSRTATLEGDVTRLASCQCITDAPTPFPGPAPTTPTPKTSQPTAPPVTQAPVQTPSPTRVATAAPIAMDNDIFPIDNSAAPSQAPATQAPEPVGTKYFLRVKYDSWADETSWEVMTLGLSVLHSGSGTSSNNGATVDYNLEKLVEGQSYYLDVFDSEYDGIDAGWVRIFKVKNGVTTRIANIDGGSIGGYKWVQFSA